MTEKRRLTRSDIFVGITLPWNIYDEDGHLLLKKGSLLDSEDKVDRLIERGVYAAAGSENFTADKAPAVREKKSALAQIIEARRILKQASTAAIPGEDFSAQVMSVVGLIEQACQINQNAALATILLHREERYSIRHSIDSALITHLIGIHSGMHENERRSVTAAALTMNISMLDLQDDLQSRAAPLTPEERLLIENHPIKSAEILGESGVGDDLWLMTLQDHHESISGVGYPAHKKGDDVLLPTRIVSLADVYCAKISGRDYRPPMRPNEAMRSLYLGQGGSIETFLAAQLVKSLGVYPPGTSVRLKNGEIAIVTHLGEKATAPIACSIYNGHGQRLEPAIRRDTALPTYTIVDVVTLSSMGSSIDFAALWGKEA